VLGAAPAVVFTTTDCVYCPDVIERLARDIRERDLEASLLAVRRGRLQAVRCLPNWWVSFRAHATPARERRSVAAAPLG
jgi:hypothetical protein